MHETCRPEAAEVGRRIVVLSCVVSRVRSELAGLAPPDAARSVIDWLRNNDLHESASLRELRFLSTPPGVTARQELVQLSWRTEACATLLWATCHLAQFPAWDALADPHSLLDALADAHHAPTAFIARIRLRPTAELDSQRQTAVHHHQQATNQTQDSRPRSIARERLFALNWICGKSPGADWEATPLDL